MFLEEIFSGGGVANMFVSCYIGSSIQILYSIHLHMIGTCGTILEY